ncbi:MAG TPA: class II aldolase/adducin family protein [Streptosporangiaceae bacterium]|nr:class II aldolase/adducin family protein [Streptosporangiaceae bacterium]
MRQPDVAELRRCVAQACRILALQGLAEDVLGHVSVRTGPAELLIRCRGPQERGLLFTTPADVHLVPLNGATPELPGGYRIPSELPIHAEVLRRRPQVQAVVHAHPPGVITADLAGLRLRPIVGAYNIPAMRLALDGVPVYPRGVLIRRAELAAEMADAMGDAPACVLRGHGVTTAGASIAEAVICALNLESLARITLGAASAGGQPAELPAQDIAELPDLGATLNEQYLWRHHLARLEHAGLAV